MALLICGKCGKEPNPSKGAPYCECPHCGSITDERLAHALGQRVAAQPLPLCLCRHCRRSLECGKVVQMKKISGVMQSLHCPHCMRITTFEEAVELGKKYGPTKEEMPDAPAKPDYHADFEATKGPWSGRLYMSAEPSSIGEYEDPHTQFAWLGYKAGREANEKS